MELRYRDHLIFPVVSLDSVIGDWTASAHIEFTENVKVHTVVLTSGDAFQTELEAKRFIIRRAKQWVDDRFRRARVSPAEPSRKEISSESLRSNQPMYWICRPCQNNRHDLCVRHSTGRAGINVEIRCWCSSQPTHQARLGARTGEKTKSSTIRRPLSHK